MTATWRRCSLLREETHARLSSVYATFPLFGALPTASSWDPFVHSLPGLQDRVVGAVGPTRFRPSSGKNSSWVALVFPGASQEEAGLLGACSEVSLPFAVTVTSHPERVRWGEL